MTNYVDSVDARRSYNDLNSWNYLNSMFRGFQSSAIYHPSSLEEERGSLSWGAALVARSYLVIFKKTDDQRYLRAFVGIAEQLLLARDNIRQVGDYQGKSGPVWRSGRPYTTNEISFSCGATDHPCIRIRAKQADELRIDNVCYENSTASFSFVSRESGSTVLSVPEASLISGSSRSLNLVLQERHWKSPQATASITHDGCMECLPPAGSYSMNEQFYAPAVHVSQICVALLQFSELIGADPKLTAVYGVYATKYTEAASAALGVYESDYRVLGDLGYYVIPSGAPNDFESTDAPQNHNMSMALCFILLFRVTGDSFYLDRAEQLMRTFKESLSTADVEGASCVVWNYFSPMLVNYKGYENKQASVWRSARRGNTRMEDMSHAVLAVEAAIAAHKEGIVIASSDLSGMAQTFETLSKSDSLPNYIDGSAGSGKYDSIAGRWAVLRPWGSKVYANSLRIMQSSQPQPIHASVLLACANLVE